MAGQIWAVASEGGYLYSDELSDILRNALQPIQRFRQLCDAVDGTQKGLNKGDQFHWDIVSDVGTQGRELDELQVMPETGFTITQGSMTVTEYGNSVPFTGKLQSMAKFQVVNIIDKALKNDAAKLFDIISFLEFRGTPLVVAPTGGTDPDAVTLSTNGTTATTNDVALGTGHVKAIGDMMRERNIPAYTANDDYIAISHPSTFRPIANELEDVHQYTPEGQGMVYSGEKGRYEGFRFIEQTNIPKGGPENSTTFDPYTKTGDPWTNGKSSWAFFCGGDTVTEGIVIPEEIRGKLPGDYGRSRGIAWYYLGGVKRVHSDPAQARIVRWASAT